MPRSLLAVIALLSLAVSVKPGLAYGDPPAGVRPDAKPKVRPEGLRRAGADDVPAHPPRAAGSFVGLHVDDRDDDDKEGKAPLHAARNAGVIDGQVVGVDYRAGTITVKTADRGRVEVQMLPSTIIQGDNAGFRGFTDIAKGARVKIFASQRGGAYSAQIINLK